MTDYYTTWSLSGKWHIFTLDGEGEEVKSLCKQLESTETGVRPVEENLDKLRSNRCNKCRQILNNEDPDRHDEIFQVKNRQ